jgi:hypothetical protein
MGAKCRSVRLLARTHRSLGPGVREPTDHQGLHLLGEEGIHGIAEHPAALEISQDLCEDLAQGF